MKKYFKKIAKIAVVFVVFLVANPAFAQIVDSRFYRWTVYELQEDELQDKQCYIVAHPENVESDQQTRQRPYIMITRFQRERKEEVSVFGGYEFKLNSKIFFMIDDEYQYRFPTKGDMAWAKNKMEDVEVIQRMLNAKKIKIRSDSAIGSFAIDEYSTKGIAKAYARMREICK